MKFLVVIGVLFASATAQTVTYCYQDEARITQDAGGVGLFDLVTVDNQKHQMSPYDLQEYDVFVSLTRADNGHKCGSVKLPGNSQVHEVNCGGTKARFVHFVAKGEFIVMCSLSVKGRPLPATTTTTTPAPTTTTTTTPAPTTAPAKLNKNCEEVGQADIIFIIDASGSVKLAGFKDELKFVTAVIAQLKHVRPDGQGIRISAMTYSYAHKIVMGPRLNAGQGNAAIRNQINGMQWTRGGTFTFAALAKAGAEMRSYGRPGIPHIIVTLTDGISASAPKTISQANSLRGAGNHLMSVGIGSNLRHSELNAMADSPNSKFKFVVHDFRLLDAIVSKVKKAMFCAPGP